MGFKNGKHAWKRETRVKAFREERRVCRTTSKLYTTMQRPRTSKAERSKAKRQQQLKRLMNIIGALDELGPARSTRQKMERRVRCAWAEFVALHLRDGSFREMHRMHHEDFQVLGPSIKF